MSNKPLSPKILSKLNELLEDVYPIARDSVIYAEVVTEEFNYVFNVQQQKRFSMLYRL